MTRTTPPLTSDSTNAIGMPLVGFGTYQMSVEQAEQSVAEALKVGFRHIDSAQGYNNEVGTGNALKASGIPREELFVTTKLFPGYSAWGAPEKTFEDTIASCEQSLKELQLDYVDLYLIHLPSASTRLEQYKSLVELQKMGKVRHIGVSNYDVRHLQELEAANLPTPAVNQVEFHPLCAQAKLTPYMLERKILPVAYSSLATMSDWRAKQCQGGDTKADEKGAAQALQQELCQKLSVNEAQLLLRWGCNVAMPF